MSTIVAAALVAHAPGITRQPDVAHPEQRERLHAGYHEVGRRLRAARPNLIVMFVNDHIQNFAFDTMPAFCVALAEGYAAPGPAGGAFLRLPARSIPGRPVWAMALLRAALEAGFDLAYAHEIESWDEMSVPLHFLTPAGDVPVVALYTNCAAPPLPTPARCHALGTFVGEFVRCQPDDERVALVASGGLSHWVGTPDTGRINPDFDRRVLAQVAGGEGATLARLDHASIEREAGNGGQEVRNWIALLGAVPGWRGEVLAYEPVAEWITGCATVWMAPGRAEASPVRLGA